MGKKETRVAKTGLVTLGFAKATGQQEAAGQWFPGSSGPIEGFHGCLAIDFGQEDEKRKAKAKAKMASASPRFSWSMRWLRLVKGQSIVTGPIPTLF